MGIFDRFKKKAGQEALKKEKPGKKVEEKAKEEKQPSPNKEKIEATKYSSLKLKEEAKSASPVGGVKEKRVQQKDDTKNAYKILIKPLVTEKATALVAQNKYSFAVANKANKIEIKKAIKSLYGAEPLNVNLINMRGKRVQSGKVSGKKKVWKKAIVTLKPGQKIEIYEGV